MTSKICARCDKTVYPIEELKCLDKIWHKTCFKCYECNMILNMKTYKGFNKMPYCNAHCPQARATTVVDTPETRRLAENTKIQSQAKYHEAFERSRGKLTQVADDPETLRIRNASKIISNVSYHGDYEKKKQMEERRNLLNPDNNNAVVAVNNNIHPINAFDYAANNNNHTDADAYRATYNNGAQPKSKQDYYKMTSKVPSNYPPVNSASYDPRYGPAPQHQLPQQQQQPLRGYTEQPAQPYYPNLTTTMGPRFTGQNLGRCFRAIYDYTAQDTDEVSFVEGDMLIHCQPIDEGWMNGTVQRTAQTGMLPSNYVESV